MFGWTTGQRTTSDQVTCSSFRPGMTRGWSGTSRSSSTASSVALRSTPRRERQVSDGLDVGVAVSDAGGGERPGEDAGYPADGNVVADNKQPRRPPAGPAGGLLGRGRRRPGLADRLVHLHDLLAQLRELLVAVQLEFGPTAAADLGPGPAYRGMAGTSCSGSALGQHFAWVRVPCRPTPPVRAMWGRYHAATEWIMNRTRLPAPRAPSDWRRGCGSRLPAPRGCGRGSPGRT
jgi:hypothetical protein